MNFWKKSLTAVFLWEACMNYTAMALSVYDIMKQNENPLSFLANTQWFEGTDMCKENNEGCKKVPVLVMGFMIYVSGGVEREVCTYSW